MVDSHINSTILETNSTYGDIACQKAIAKKLEGITFVNHLDCVTQLKLSNWLKDFSKYSKLLHEMKFKYHEKLFIYNGISFNSNLLNMEDVLKIINLYNFDYVTIGMKSLQVLDNRDAQYLNQDGQTNKCNYIEDLINMIKRTKNFDVLSNIIDIARYYNLEENNFSNSPYFDIVDELLKNLIAQYKGLEIDATYLNKKKIENVLVNNLLNLLKRYKNLGGELVSIGSYSNDTNSVGYNFDTYKDCLIECGFKFTMHYTNRNPIYDKLSK